MKTIRILFLLAALFSLLAALPSSLVGQSGSEPPVYLGAAVGMTMRWQEGTMLTTDGNYDCCSFTGGNGVGAQAGLRLLLPLSSGFFLRAGAGWEYASADFSSERKSYPILGEDNRVEYVDFQDDLELTFPAITAEVGIVMMILDPGLYLTAGGGLTIPFPPSWKQTETITGPADVKYLDGERSRLLVDIDVPLTRPFISLRFGGGALVPVSDEITLQPEMMYSIPLMDMQPDFHWSVSGIELTMGMLFHL